MLLPPSALVSLGFPDPGSYLFLRLLGWAYLALCVSYGFGLQASLRGVRAAGPIWVGIVSNGGACVLLLYFGISGVFASFGVFAQASMWLSAMATGLITLSLLLYGVFGRDA